MGTLCIYLNFKMNLPNSAKLRGGGLVKGEYPRGDMGGGGGRAIFCFMCVNCMVEQCVGLMNSIIFLKIVQLGTFWCICLSDVGINNF